MNYIYECSELDNARMRGVGALFEHLASPTGQPDFKKFTSLLERAQTRDVKRSAAPAALWWCSLHRDERQRPFLAFTTVTDILANGISGGAIQLLGPDVDQPLRYKSLVCAYMPDELMQIAASKAKTPEVELATKAVALLNMIGSWQSLQLKRQAVTP